MKLLSIAADFAATMSSVMSPDGLIETLSQACETMGVRYFALSHHVDFMAAPNAVRVHNYPAGWQEWYDTHRIGLSDPVHRASHRTATGFLWSDLERLVPLSRADHRLLQRGREIGLGDGLTIPAHVPGEARGSCTFVAEAGQALPDHALLVAQTIGMFAFEVARRLDRKTRNVAAPRISDRQRQCIALAGRGLSDKLIGRVLGIGQQTVLEHMREARAKLGVRTRTQLVVCLLAAGELCINDVQSYVAV